MKTFVDLFAGIGGFRIGFERHGGVCVYSSEIDKHACEVYKRNFGVDPYSDITAINASDIPDFDILCAGFPCQPFSISGRKEGFLDKTRGTLFFDIARILAEKKPVAFVLENVKNLALHDGGKTLNVILETLSRIGYTVSYEILNAKDFGVPQNRERIFLIGYLDGTRFDFSSLRRTPTWSMEQFLDEDGDFQILNPSEYTLLTPEQIHTNPSGLCFVGYRNKNIRKNGVRPNTEHLSRVHKQPNRIYSVKGTHPTLSAGETSGRYFIYDGTIVRKLTLQECFRFFGFPEDFQKPGTAGQLYKRIGNSVCIPVVEAIAEQMLAT